MTGASPGGGAAPADLGRELAVAEALALEAGEVVRRHAERGTERRHKAGGELVTAADLEANAVIRDGLRAAFPEDALLSEETPDSRRRLASPRTWIVDPIDGTEDFASGGDEHAISIGLAIGGAPVLGVVCNPARRELFAGAAGRGVTLDGHAVRVTPACTLAGARLTFSRTEWLAGGDQLARVLPIRPMSSAAYKLARVAAGLDDGTLSLWPRKEWDVCAGVALVRAAGGEATLTDGAPIAFNRPEVRLGQGLVAAGGPLHRLLLAELARLGPGAGA